MIVGNGDVTEGLAATIDAADLVVRFNDCRSYGAGGTKTDVIAVCNTGRPALSMLGGGKWKTSAAVREVREIWCARSPQKFECLRTDLAATHPEFDDLCDDYSAGFRAFAEATAREFVQFDGAVHSMLDDRLKQLDAEPYIVPSSGLLVIATVLEKWAHAAGSITIVGFGHQGWFWHPFASERLIVDRWVAEGRLTRLT
ncbi:Urease operon accessory protein [Rhizobium sp. 32-5/1]|uniref:Urease operon accessory protein n=1 Tax=Rhizobium sp. 32-5/1 TaxID=3019602 RepID=UPI00240DA180|nr:Urease operon accessory protein [Rhizobium sp. 32-5/1]WEZ82791.1 Urease operon accessory protein [Rhizobium sp. 32-5/1]